MSNENTGPAASSVPLSSRQNLSLHIFLQHRRAENITHSSFLFSSQPDLFNPPSTSLFCNFTSFSLVLFDFQIFKDSSFPTYGEIRGKTICQKLPLFAYQIRCRIYLMGSGEIRQQAICKDRLHTA